MRARLIRPEFFRDSRMGRLSRDLRLFYISIWTVADDAGFLEWDPVEIGAALYPYDPPDERERNVKEWAKVLVREKRIEVLSCKKHARIPTIERWKIPGGKQYYGVRTDHEKGCRSVPKRSRSGSIRTNPDWSRSLPSPLPSPLQSPSAPEREEEETPKEWRDLGEQFGRRKGVRSSEVH